MTDRRLVSWIVLFVASAASAQVVGILNGADPLIGKEQPGLAAEINGPGELAFNRGSLYVLAAAGNQIYRIDLARNTATLVLPAPDELFTKDPTKMELPFALAVTPSGEIYFSDVGGKLGKVDTAKNSSSVVRKGLLADFPSVRFMVSDAAGRILLTERHSILRWTPTTDKLELVTGSTGFKKRASTSNEESAVSASFSWPQGVALNARGDIFIADTDNCRIVKLDAATNVVTAIAGNGSCDNSGDGGPAKLAQVDHPRDIVLDSKGNLYFTSSCRIRRIDTSGVISNYAGANGCTSGCNGNHRDGERAEEANVSAAGMAFDEQDNLYFSDYSHNIIRKIDHITHLVTTVAGNGQPHRVDIIL